MPFVALGLHLLAALFFAIHAVRTGQPMYWLIILFTFPLLGSIVYGVAVYLPNSRLERGARKALRSAVQALDPARELRAARQAFDLAPTAQHRMRLAAALLEAGQAEQAAAAYEACLAGPFAGDHDIRYGAARAHLAAGRPAQAAEYLQTIRAADAGYRTEALALLLARALAEGGRAAEARGEYEATVARFGSFEARAEYAIWAAQLARHDADQRGIAIRLQAELEQAMRHWNRHTRELNQPLLRRLREAYAPLERSA